MARDDELTALSEEIESVADFLRILQHEYTQLRNDFAAVLHAAGGTIVVTESDFTPPASAIERTEELRTGITTFRLRTE